MSDSDPNETPEPSKSSRKKTDPKEKIAQFGNMMGKKFTDIGKKMGDGINQTKSQIEKRTQEKKRFRDDVEKEMHRIQQEEYPEHPEQWHEISHAVNQSQTPTVSNQTLIKPPVSPAARSTSPIQPVKPAVKKPSHPTESNKGPKVLDLMTPEMLNVYNEAKTATNDGQDSLAVKMYEYLLELAKKEGIPEVIRFVEQRLKEL